MDYHTSSVSPGKTAPRLLEDLLDYDARYQKKGKHHVLADPPPLFRDSKKAYPLRTSIDACRHALLLKESNEDEANGDFNSSAPSAVSAVCSRCLYHFHITVDHTNGGILPREPCALSSQNTPLHHFRCVHNKSNRNVPLTATSKYDGHTELHHFKCSNTKCPVYVEIKIIPPRLSADCVKRMSNRANLERRFNAARSQCPERFTNQAPISPAEAVYILYRYVRDATLQTSGEKKKISKKNKRLLLAFGDDCDGIFNYLGFEPSRGVDDTGELQDFWNLPYPNGNPEQRNFLRDVEFELVQWTRGIDPEHGLPPLPPSAMKAIQRSLGCWEYPKRSRQRDIDSVEHPHYASLGACENFTDDFIRYCYVKQKMCDPANKHYYLDCLVGIANGRGSTDLEVEYTKEESCGELRYSKILEAYRFFILDQSSFGEEDEHIIGVYRSRIDNAPLQKEKARECLKIIGLARGSSELIALADDKSMSVQEAYEFLGVSPETTSDIIEAVAVAKNYDGGDSHQLVKALRVIANFRIDTGLHSVATRFEPQDSNALDIAQAYKTLQIEDPTMSDANILVYYASLMQRAVGQGSKDSYTKALKAIGLERKSDLLLAKLDNPAAVVGNRAATAEHPVGLRNIGNTCYLNSLLQFYYTVKPIRHIAINFQDYRLNIESGVENPEKVKKVSNEDIPLDEILKAQQFVEELGILFSNLKTASTSDIRPSQRLAELALLSTSAEERLIAERSPDTTHVAAEGPSAAADDKGVKDSPNFRIQPFPPPATRPTPPPSEDGSVDVVMTDDPPVYQTTENDDTSNFPSNTNPSVAEGKGKRIQSPQRDPTPEPEIINGIDPSVDDTMGEDCHDSSMGVVMPPSVIQPPPIPPRNKPGPIDTASANGRPFTSNEKLKFGAQQDVNEVLANVLFRFSCAIRPSGFDQKGNQIDEITNLFFGVNTIHVEKPGGLESKPDTWQHLQIYPDEHGTRSIYEALDVYCDKQLVDLNGEKVPQFTCIKKLPPILQLLIPRSNLDTTTGQVYKNQNWVAAHQTIYLDRYLDSDAKSSLMARKREKWIWKEKLKTLEDRRRFLNEGKPSVNYLTVSEMLQTTADALKAIQEEEVDGISINPELIDVLEDRSAATARELEFINREIAELKKRLDDQFADLRTYQYSLHAVFMHRGTSLAGHYWIYIYDFVNNVWREYNDERVSIVEDTNRIFSPDTGGGNKATPYLLVYVDEQQKSQLVEAVCRDLQAPSNYGAHSSVRPVDEYEDEGIDMSDGYGGSSMHVEHT